MRFQYRTPPANNRSRTFYQPNFRRGRYPLTRFGNRVYGAHVANPRRSVRPRVVTRLFSDTPGSSTMTSQVMEEVHEGADYMVLHNSSRVSYITYPAMCRSHFASRSRGYIKVLQVNVSGSAVLRNIEGSIGDGGGGIHGIFTTILVRDKKPCQYSALEPLIPYAELFGPESSSCATLRVRDPHKERFSVLHQKKTVVNTDMLTHLFRFNYSVKFKSYPFWVSFKDLSEDDRSGLYGNVAKNAIIVYYVWLCSCNVTSELHVKYDTTFVG